MSDDDISLNTKGVSIQVYRAPEMAAANVTITADDQVAVQVNGRPATRARDHDELGEPVEFWDLSLMKNPIDGVAMVWRYPNGTVFANVNAEMDPSETCRLAAKLLEASGVPLMAIAGFLSSLPSKP